MTRSPRALTTQHLVMASIFLLVILVIGAGTFLAADRARAYAPLASITMTPLSTTLPPEARVVITKATLISTSLLRVEIRGKQIAGDWLFESPLLLLGDKKFSPSPTSLKATRLSFLSSATAGEAVGILEFEIGAALSPVQHAALIFNPSSQYQSLVSPRLEVGFEWGVLRTATPNPTSPPFVSDSRVLVESASFVSETRLRVNFVSQTGLLLYAEAPLLTIGETKLLPTAESFKAFTALAGGKRLSLEFDLDEKGKVAGSGRLVFNTSSQSSPGGGMSPRIEIIVVWK